MVGDSREKKSNLILDSITDPLNQTNLDNYLISVLQDTQANPMFLLLKPAKQNFLFLAIE